LNRSPGTTSPNPGAAIVQRGPSAAGQSGASRPSGAGSFSARHGGAPTTPSFSGRSSPSSAGHVRTNTLPSSFGNRSHGGTNLGGSGSALAGSGSFAHRYAWNNGGAGRGSNGSFAGARSPLTSTLRKDSGTWNGSNNWNGSNSWNGDNYRSGYDNWNRNGNWNGSGYGNRYASYRPGLRYSPYGYGGYGYGLGGFGSGFGLGYGYGPYRYGYGFGNAYPYGLVGGLVSRLLFGGYGLGYGGFGGYGLGYGGYGNYGPFAGAYGYGSTTSTYYSPTYVTNVPATTTDPNVLPAASDFSAQGEAAFRNGDYDGAVRNWQHAIVDDPQNATLALMIGQALFAQGKYEEAAGAVQAALQNMPPEQWNVVVANAGELYGLPAVYADQVKTLEAAAAQTPSPDKHFLLGYHHGFLGDPARAVQDLDAGLALAPQDAVMRQLRDTMQAKFAAATAAKTDI